MVIHIRSSAKDKEVAENQFAVIAPVTHCAFFGGGGSKETIVGELNVGDATFGYESLIYKWFDYWLKGEDNGVVKETPKFQYYTMGLNKWQSAETWPPAGAKMTAFYLTSKGNANSVFGDGKLTLDRPGSADKPDAFTYDPDYPVPIHGGGFCCMGSNYKEGCFDLREIEARNDILVYSTDPLKEGLEISGPATGRAMIKRCLSRSGCRS